MKFEEIELFRPYEHNLFDGPIIILEKLVLENQRFLTFIEFETALYFKNIPFNESQIIKQISKDEIQHFLKIINEKRGIK